MRRPVRRSGKASDGAFPIPVLLFTAALGATGIAGGLVGQRLVNVGEMPTWVTLLSLLILLTVAAFPPLEFQYRGQVATIDPFESILAPAVFLLPPLAVVIMVGASQALSERLQRVHPVKACFNIAQLMAAAAAGSIVFHLVRVDATMSPRNLAALILAMASISLVNLAALLLVLLLTRGQPLRSALTELAPAMVRGALVGLALNLAFGVIFASTAAFLPHAMLPLLVPLPGLLFTARAYASGRAARRRVAGMQRAPHALAVPIDPRAAVPELLV